MSASNSTVAFTGALHVVRRRRDANNICLHVDLRSSSSANSHTSGNTEGDVLLSRHSHGFDLHQYHRYRCFDSLAFHPNIGSTYAHGAAEAVQSALALRSNTIIFVHGALNDTARVDVFREVCRQVAADALETASGAWSRCVTVSLVDLCHLWGAVDLLDPRCPLRAKAGLNALKKNKVSFANTPRSHAAMRPTRVRLHRGGALGGDGSESAASLGADGSEALLQTEATIDDIIASIDDLPALRLAEEERIEREQSATVVLSLFFTPPAPAASSASGLLSGACRETESAIHVVLLPPPDHCSPRNRTGTELTAVENCLRAVVQHHLIASKGGAPQPHLPIREAPVLVYLEEELQAAVGAAGAAAPAGSANGSRSNSPSRHNNAAMRVPGAYVGGDRRAHPASLAVVVVGCVNAGANKYPYTHGVCEFVRRVCGPKRSVSATIGGNSSSVGSREPVSAATSLLINTSRDHRGAGSAAFRAAPSSSAHASTITDDVDECTSQLEQQPLQDHGDNSSGALQPPLFDASASDKSAAANPARDAMFERRSDNDHYVIGRRRVAAERPKLEPPSSPLAATARGPPSQPPHPASDSGFSTTIVSDDSSIVVASTQKPPHGGDSPMRAQSRMARRSSETSPLSARPLKAVVDVHRRDAHTTAAHNDTPSQKASATAAMQQQQHRGDDDQTLALRIQVEQLQRSTQVLHDQLRRVTAERDGLQGEVAAMREARRAVEERDVPALLDEMRLVRRELEKTIAERAGFELEARRCAKEAKAAAAEADELRRQRAEAERIADERAAELKRVSSQLEELHTKYARLELQWTELRSERYAASEEGKALRIEAEQARRDADDAVSRARAAEDGEARLRASWDEREALVDALQRKLGALEAQKREAAIELSNRSREIESLQARNVLLERRVASVSHLAADSAALETLRRSHAQLEEALREERRKHTATEIENTALRLRVDDLLIQCGELQPQVDALLEEEERRWTFGIGLDDSSAAISDAANNSGSAGASHRSLLTVKRV